MLQTFQTAILLAPLLIAGTQACVRVHTNLNTDPVTGDSMAIQVWNNKDKICDGSAHQYWASDQTSWSVDCIDAWEIKLDANGMHGEIWNHQDGYHADLTDKYYKKNKYCRYQTGLNDRCAGWVFDYEHVLWDGFGDCSDKLNVKGCGQPTCDLPKDDEVAIGCTIGILNGGENGCKVEE